MPVRTRRGRAAAYRALWTWPLHSPLRFAGVLAGLAVLVALLAALAGEPATPAAGGLSSGSATGALGTGAPGTGDRAAAPPELTPRRLPPADAPAAALTAAQRFTAAWTAHGPGTTPAGWLGGLAPWTTEEFLPVLSSTDPARVPATRLAGAAVPVDVRPDAVRVLVPTDAGRIRLLLVQPAPGQWRVAGLDPAG